MSNETKEDKYKFTLQNLHVGNLILNDGSEEIVDVDTLIWLNSYPEQFNRVYKPIPITEDIMRRTEAKNTWNKTTWYLGIDDDSLCLCADMNIQQLHIATYTTFGDDDDVEYSLQVNGFYMHIMQGLYQSISGKELTLKDNE